MSTIKATLEADADGTLHLPVPSELRHGKWNVTAILEPVDETCDGHRTLKGFGCLKGKLSITPDFAEPLEDFTEYMK